jgi:hypothetical protein
MLACEIIALMFTIHKHPTFAEASALPCRFLPQRRMRLPYRRSPHDTGR